MLFFIAIATAESDWLFDRLIEQCGTPPDVSGLVEKLVERGIQDLEMFVVHKMSTHGCFEWIDFSVPHYLVDEMKPIKNVKITESLIKYIYKQFENSWKYKHPRIDIRQISEEFSIGRQTTAFRVSWNIN